MTEEQKSLPQHSSRSVEHYTPLWILDAARRVLGTIDLDPATSSYANAKRVRAERFFTREDDGLSRDWIGRVWLNPPGGRVGARSSAAVWWEKLAHEYQSQRVIEAVFLGFSIEILATAQDAPIWPGSLPFCVPRRRIEFDRETAHGEYVSGDSPTHANIIVYLPRNDTPMRSTRSFIKAFENFGKVRP